MGSNSGENGTERLNAGGGGFQRGEVALLEGNYTPDDFKTRRASFHSGVLKSESQGLLGIGQSGQLWSKGAEGILTREDYLDAFKELTARMLDITRRKNNDYGGADDPFKNFREFGELGMLVRMSDKWARIKTALAEKRELAVSDESVEDTILDLANYCLLLLCYRKRALQ